MCVCIVVDHKKPKTPENDVIPLEYSADCESSTSDIIAGSIASKQSEVKTLYVNPTPSVTQSVNQLYHLETKEKTRRCIIILMALLMRCLMLILEEYFTYFFKTSFANFHLNKVFLPLIAFEIIDYRFFEPPLVRFSSLTALVLLKLNSQYTQTLMTTLNTILRLSQDVVVYFVTFISFDFVIGVILDER